MDENTYALAKAAQHLRAAANLLRQTPLEHKAGGLETFAAQFEPKIEPLTPEEREIVAAALYDQLADESSRERLEGLTDSWCEADWRMELDLLDEDDDPEWRD